MFSRNILQSFKCAFHGVIYTLKTQRNMRIHFYCAIGAVLAGILLNLNTIEMAILFCIISFVLIAEVVNTTLENNLDFLTYSPQNVPERHRSLRAVFDHSWSLLSEEEKGVFARLSVFRGRFQREAAERVADASLFHLLALMRKSLLHRSPKAWFNVCMP